MCVCVCVHVCVCISSLCMCVAMLLCVCLGWWMVDAQGLIGWAPASYLVPLNEGDEQEEGSENIMEREQEHGKA